jgi:hypothetical protein
LRRTMKRAVKCPPSSNCTKNMKFRCDMCFLHSIPEQVSNCLLPCIRSLIRSQVTTLLVSNLLPRSSLIFKDCDLYGNCVQNQIARPFNMLTQRTKMDTRPITHDAQSMKFMAISQYHVGRHRFPCKERCKQSIISKEALF